MKNKKNTPKKGIYQTFIFLLLTFLITNIAFAQNAEQDIRPLPINKTIERQLKGGDSHTYKIKLKQSQVIRIDLVEKGVDTKLSVLNVDKRESLKTANMGLGNQREILTFIAKKEGLFYIKTEAGKGNSIDGSYELITTKQTTASLEDIKRMKAESLLMEGMSKTFKKNRKNFQEAINKWEESSIIWNKLNEKYWAGYSNLLLGQAYYLLGKKQKSLQHYDAALSLFESVKDKNLQIKTLNEISSIYDLLGDKKKTLSYYNQTLVLLRDAENKKGEAVILNNIGFLYKEIAEEQKALKYYFQALSLRRSVDDKKGEAITLYNIGLTYESLGERKKALKYFLLSLPLRRTVNDKKGEAKALYSIGSMYFQIGKLYKSLEYLKQALPVYQKINDTKTEINILSNIGVMYKRLEDRQKALEYFKRALRLYGNNKKKKAFLLTSIGGIHHLNGDNQLALEYLTKSLSSLKNSKDIHTKARTYNILGVTYSRLGDMNNAIIYYLQSLNLRRKINDEIGEVNSLINIGRAYKLTANYKKALNYYNQAIKLSTDINRNIGILNLKGSLYDSLGEKRKALKFIHQALILSEKSIGKNKKAETYGYLASVYENLKENTKALKYYKLSVDLFEELKNSYGMVSGLNNIGLFYKRRGEKQKALNCFNQAQSIAEKTNNIRAMPSILNNIGRIYEDIGERQKALQYFKNALLLRKISSDKRGEVVTLTNKMFFWDSLKEARIANFYGKLAVYKYQKIRVLSKQIDNESQKALLKNFKTTYQKLAGVLIKEDEVDQAVQILNLYQNQQFFDAEYDFKSPIKQAYFSSREQSLANRYELTSDKVGKIGAELNTLKLDIGKRKPSKKEKSKLKYLETQSKSTTDDFLKVFKDAELEFSQKPDEKDIVTPIKDVSDMQSALQELSSSTKQRTAALYTLIGEKKFYVLLITRKGKVKAFESPIDRKDFNKKILQYYRLLQEPNYDPRKLGEELYKIIIPKKLEKELKKQKIKTLMWQLDENLRYIPMASLYDGKKYLVEKYQNVVFTRADKERLTKAVSPNWTGVGFGTSKAHKVDLLGDKNFQNFPALIGVKKELSNIFQTDKQDIGVMNGNVSEDKEFTKDKFYKALKQKNKVVHIASHFRFYPGDSSLSFLLLGDGKPLTLNELKKQKRLFDGVELLTLSACETGAVVANADGREIDGFAELAQRLGADAVMATLWRVQDTSTAELMRDFYSIRQTKNLNKAESLRKAQLKLLKGKTDLEFDDTKNDPRSSKRKSDIEKIKVEKKYRVIFDRNDEKPFAHPYYWSPFVLFGNWK